MILAAPDLSLTIRPAVPAETSVLEQLIAASARAHGVGFYSDAETEAAIVHVFGVDSDLIADRTYFVAIDAGGAIVGCGGWSRLRTLFGGDRFAGRTPGLLDPAEDAARIRAFFVAPGQARRGIASGLLAACEGAAAEAGFRRFQLMATLPGVPFYAAHNYRAAAPISYRCGDQVISFIPMDKYYVA